MFEPLFCGALLIVFTSLTGIPDSVSYQPFVALPLDITEDTRSVEQAIASFMREEPVFGFLKPGTQQVR
jgi:hypothetical protein